jgi:hypothetical protein
VATCFIIGGLGNQLFQIMTTIAYAIRYKYVFLFPYTIEVYKNRFSYWDSFLLSLKRFTTENPKNIRKITDLHYLPKFQERDFSFSPISNMNKSICFQGYFQSYLYFEKEKEYIFKLICLREQQEKIHNDFFENVDSKNTIHISMHFRLGDYIFLQNCHPVLSIDYYEKSLEYILSKMENKDKQINIWYCCEKNDNDVVYKNIQSLELKFIDSSLKFIKIKDEIPDWQQMLMMSLCDHHIIANSTFSWWGAYFHRNDSEKPIITYPSVWFGPHLCDKNVSDLFPKDWIKIQM